MSLHFYFRCFVFTCSLFTFSANVPAQTIPQFIDAYAKQNNFSGNILVEKNGRAAYSKRFGLANREFKVPVKIDTKFKIASITKAFTAVLILQLHEQGKLDVNKTIGAYLPDYTGDARDKVTIHQLLSHTSGMPNIDRAITSAENAIKNGILHYQNPFSTEDLVKRFCSEKLVNEPGKVFDYNNAEYLILGKIIERIHGKTFDDVLNEKILMPLKMFDSGMAYQYRVMDNFADTYFFRADLKQIVRDMPAYIENWYASGSMYSTVGDLAKFSRALYGEKLISQRTLEAMKTPRMDDYGYGVWAYDMTIGEKKHRVVKRPGRIMGANSMLFHMPGDDVTIIMLANTDATDLDEFAAAIARHIFK